MLACLGVLLQLRQRELGAEGGVGCSGHAGACCEPGGDRRQAAVVGRFAAVIQCVEAVNASNVENERNRISVTSQCRPRGAARRRCDRKFRPRA